MGSSFAVYLEISESGYRNFLELIWETAKVKICRIDRALGFRDLPSRYRRI